MLLRVDNRTQTEHADKYCWKFSFPFSPTLSYFFCILIWSRSAVRVANSPSYPTKSLSSRSGLHFPTAQLTLREEDVSLLLECQSHLRAKNSDVRMWTSIFRQRGDGNFVAHLSSRHQPILTSKIVSPRCAHHQPWLGFEQNNARCTCCNDAKNPSDVIAVSARPYVQRSCQVRYSHERHPFLYGKWLEARPRAFASPKPHSLDMHEKAWERKNSNKLEENDGQKSRTNSWQWVRKAPQLKSHRPDAWANSLWPGWRLIVEQRDCRRCSSLPKAKIWINSSGSTGKF